MNEIFRSKVNVTRKRSFGHDSICPGRTMALEDFQNLAYLAQWFASMKCVAGIKYNQGSSSKVKITLRGQMLKFENLCFSGLLAM